MVSSKVYRVSGSALDVVQRLSVQAEMDEGKVVDLLIKHGALSIKEKAKQVRGSNGITTIKPGD